MRLLTVIALVLVAGCSSSSPTPDAPSAPSGPVAPGDFGAAFAKASCDTLAPCCAETGLSMTESGCEAKLEGPSNLAAKAALPGTTWNADAAGKCIDAVRARARACRVPAGDDSTTICEALFVGMGNAGDACTDDVQCAPPPASSGNCSTTGKCIPIFVDQAGTAGAACTLTCALSDPCFSVTSNVAACRAVDGLRCSDMTKTCVAFVAKGGACGTHDECTPGTYCDPASSTCAVPRAAGMPCTSAGSAPECATGLCMKGTCGWNRPTLSGLLCAT